LAPLPPGHSEDRNAADEQREADRPRRKEELFDLVVKERPQHRSREKRHDNGDQEFSPIFVATGKPFEDEPHARPIEPQHRGDRTRLDDDRVRVRSLRLGDVEPTLRDQEMTRRADGEVFREPFDEPEDECLDPIHARSLRC
jgi:hypothetical protein